MIKCNKLAHKGLFCSCILSYDKMNAHRINIGGIGVRFIIKRKIKKSILCTKDSVISGDEWELCKQNEEQKQIIIQLKQQLELQNDLLTQKKQELEAIIENISDDLLIFDKNGRVTTHHRATSESCPPIIGDLENIGDQPSQIKYYNSEGDIISEDQIPSRRVLSGDKLTGYQMEIRSDEKSVYTQINGRPIYDKDGNFIAGILSCRDITENMRITASLKESEEKYRDLFNNMVTGNTCYKIIMDEMGKPIDYLVTEINPAYEKMVGLTHGGIVGKRATEIFAMLDEPPYERIKIIGDVALTGKPVFIETYSRVTKKWYNVTCYSPKKGYAASIFTDITSRKKNDEELEKTRMKLIEAQEAAKLGYWERDILNNKNYWSDEIYKIFGLEPQSIIPIASSYYEYVHPDDLDYCREASKQLREGKINYFEYRYVAVDGKVGWISSRLKSFFDEEGKMTTLRGYIQEITERKLLELEIVRAKEIAEEESLLKSEYIANMSHELRTPLNVMLGAIQLFNLYINEDVAANKEKITKFLPSMKQNCLRLIRLVNNLIDSTKIDAGYMKLQLRNHNIVSVVEEIGLSISEFAKLKNIEVIFDCEIEEKVIACDVDSIERIVLNVLSNAIKFIKGEGLIFIKVFCGEQKVIISIKDNGIGIPEDKTEMIFERYKQVNKGLTRQEEGSGIGLSLSRSLAEMHGGKMYAKGVLGQGSEFFIELPDRMIEFDKSDDTAMEYKIESNLIEKMNVEFSDIYL